MAKKEIDWSNIGFGYIKTDYRYVSNFKDGSWDEGTLTTDDMITLNECACVFQYAQTCFEGLKAYTTEDGHIVTFRPDLNAERMMNSAARLEMPRSRRSASLTRSQSWLRQTLISFRRTVPAQLFTSVRICSVQTRLSV